MKKEYCYKRKGAKVEIYVNPKGRMFLNFLDKKGKVLQSEHIADDVAKDLVRAERLKRGKC